MQIEFEIEVMPFSGQISLCLEYILPTLNLAINKTGKFKVRIT